MAAIQDVRNEYNLQDITDEPPSSAQTTNDRGKLHMYTNISQIQNSKTEKKQIYQLQLTMLTLQWIDRFVGFFFFVFIVVFAFKYLVATFLEKESERHTLNYTQQTNKPNSKQNKTKRKEQKKTSMTV